jgi:hypothetical protein
MVCLALGSSIEKDAQRRLTLDKYLETQACRLAIGHLPMSIVSDIKMKQDEHFGLYALIQFLDN